MQKNRYNKNLLENTLYDLIIIGGGINGTGILREASERGLKVLLIEKVDFAHGCTSASTRLIHGGLRYLEYLEFPLVRESLREREILLKNASHLVKPLKLLIPIYKNSKRNFLTIKLGMILYDVLSFDKTLPNHTMISKEEVKKIEPSLKFKDLTGGAVFYDSQILFPERICIENILLGNKYGATSINHCEVIDIELKNNEIQSITVEDKFTSEKIILKSKIVINVSGPWVDNIGKLISKQFKRKIGGTKGSHIIIKKFENGPHNAIYNSASDGRPFFIIPWLDYYLIGTTDIPYNENLDLVKTSEEEINYLINEANNIFEHHTINKSDILYTYSGIRPLPYQPGLKPNEQTRSHIIYNYEKEGINNFISIIGGKLTTFRSLSESAVDLIYKKLKYNFIPSKSKIIPYISTPSDIDIFTIDCINNFKKEYFLSEETIICLINLYGKNIKEVLKLIDNDKTLSEKVSPYSNEIKVQIRYSIFNEFAFTITDILLRRTSIGFSEDLGESAIEFTAKELQSFYGFSKSEINNQIEYYKKNIIDVRKIVTTQVD